MAYPRFDVPIAVKEAKVLVFGATGETGRRVVAALVRDPRVAKVTAVVRGDAPAPGFYGLTAADSISKKLTHVKVDFDALIAADKAGSSLRPNPLTGYTHAALCIGIYVKAVKSEADWMAREYDPNMAAAHFASAGGVRRLVYLSGDGVEPREKRGFFQMLFSWVKGSIERCATRNSQWQPSASDLGPLRRAAICPRSRASNRSRRARRISPAWKSQRMARRWR